MGAGVLSEAGLIVLVHGAMQNAPNDGEPYRLARAAIKAIREADRQGLGAQPVAMPLGPDTGPNWLGDH